MDDSDQMDLDLINRLWLQTFAVDHPATPAFRGLIEQLERTQRMRHFLHAQGSAPATQEQLAEVLASAVHLTNQALLVALVTSAAQTSE